jgi:CRP-like cAMP-binding protein
MAVSLAFDGAAPRGGTRYIDGAHAARTGRYGPTDAAPAFARTPQRADGLALLEEVGTTQRFAAGAIIVHEGDDVVDCFRVVAGAVRLSRLTLDGRRQVLDFRVPGELLGIPGLDVHAWTAEAIGDVELRRYPRRRLEALVEARPGLARQLLALAARELKAAQDQMLLLGRKHAHERLASFLLRMAAAAGQDEPRPGAAFDLPMSRNDIADHLGLTVETVSRAFTALRRDGILALPRPARVVLLRPAALGEIAEGNLDERLAG